MTYFAKHLRFLAAVTEALNQLPRTDEFYVHVELREAGSGEKLGQWSDEISRDDWYYTDSPVA